MRTFSNVVVRRAHRARSCWALAAALTAWSSGAAQVSLPSVNLGGTSFGDGVAGPGVLVQPMVLEIYHATRFADAAGKTMPGRNSVDVWSNLFHVGYITSHQLLGGFYGVDFLLPIARLDLNTGFGPQGTSSGFGDILVSPLTIEWPNRTMFGKPYFSRAALMARVPTGAYSPQRTVNAGTNTSGAIGYYAFTLFFRPELETSWRLQYLWNGKNSSPFAPLAVGSTQAGQAFFLNYATSYRVSNALNLGINGYYLQQVSDHRLDQNPIPNSRERVVAIGPSAQMSHGFWSLFANVDVESSVRNRPAGSRIHATLQRVFPSAPPPPR